MVSRKGRNVIAATAVGGLALATALAGPAQAAPNNNSVDKLTKAVTLESLLEHADALQAIADANGGTRASGTPGFDASADYVAGLLEDAGYNVTRQPFDFAFFEEFGSSFEQVEPVPTVYVDQTDYDLMDYSGSGDVTAEVVGVDLALANPASSTSGCEAADFVDVSGKIALMQRGACAFGLKAANAEAAGAVGAVIFNQGNSDPAVDPSRHDLFAGTLGAPVGIPTVSVSFSQGVEFSETAGLVLHMTADTTSEIRSTENVIADNGHGRTDNTVMAGGHLDSVNAGPGINDNGSGSIALLETALQMAKVKTNNHVRFAWWGAEESGLLGSEHYVASLTEDEAADIALYLNFDMVASSNFMFGIYDGDDSDAEGAGPGPDGSAAIEDVFEAYFDSRGLPHEGTDFSGRSDYGPFIAVGIPAGGLFTGAEEGKTAAQVAMYGGVAGAQLDPCYHSACDSLSPVADGADAALYAQLEAEYDLYGNLNTFAFDVNADAIATAVLSLAFDASAVNDVPRAPGKSHGAGNSQHAFEEAAA